MFTRTIAALSFLLLSAFPAWAQVEDTTETPVIDSLYYMDTSAIDIGDTTGWEDYEYTGENDQLMNEEVTYDFSTDFGPNQKNFFQGYSSLGFTAGQSDTGVRLNYGLSNEFTAGWRYKRKLTRVFALGADLGLRTAEFNISQPYKNTFLDTTFWGVSDIQHRKEKIGYYSADLGGFLRINFDPRRGNFLGKYIDLGATGSFILARRYVTVDDLNEARLKSRFTRFPYMNPLQYELTGKLGFNILALFVKYRMTDIFQDQYRFPEFARYTIGLEINSLD